MTTTERATDWNPGAVALSLRDVLRRWVDRLAATKRWTLWTALLGFGAGFLLATSNPFQDLSSAQWTFIIDHSRGGLIDVNIDASQREGNLTFRLLPRIVGKALHLGDPLHFLAIQAILGVVLLMVLARVLEEALDGDRRAAIVGTLGSIGLWAVAAGWLELRGNFDAAAVLLVLTAMLVRRPALILLCGVAASFIDERAIFVLPLVALWHLLRDEDPAVEPRPLGQLPWLPAIAAVGAAGVHLAIRVWLKVRYGLPEGSNKAPGNPWAQLNNYPNGWWGALEGYWLVAAAGLIALWHTARRRLLAVGAGLVVLAVLIIGMTVFDISRSTSFIFPIVPVALLAMRGVERSWKENLLWIAAAISLVWPMIYAADDRTVVWAYPLPLWFVDKFLNG